MKAIYSSPLRYPGGKGGFASFLGTLIEKNSLDGCDYFEPYAGGAGAALNLLRAGLVSSVHINDADQRVYRFWKTVVADGERLARRVLRAVVNIKEWKKQNAICDYPKPHSDIDVAFATLFMSRCNRSGVLSGAGPIGGYDQDGPWRLDVRFNREEIAERILNLHRLRTKITATNKDAIRFLKTKLPSGSARKRTLTYLDPPYVAKGTRLYLNAYKEQNHRELARYMKQQRTAPWVMSYDSHTIIHEIYGAFATILALPTQYSLSSKRVASELIIHPDHVAIPSHFSFQGKLTRLLPPA